MTVNVLLVTHSDIGHALMRIVATTFGQVPSNWRHLAIAYQQEPSQLTEQLNQMLMGLPGTDGTLVITDIYGATPCNIALTLKQHEPICLISGVNLPMLFKIFNYAELPLSELADKAIQGGREGIRIC